MDIGNGKTLPILLSMYYKEGWIITAMDSLNNNDIEGVNDDR